MSELRPMFPFAAFAPEAFSGFWKGFGKTAESVEPVLRNATRINLEMAGFAGNRARAYMDVPATLARCRSPQDVLGAQMQFWRTAQQEYIAFAGRIGDTWQGALSASHELAKATDGAVRDFITIPEAKPEAEIQIPPAPSRRPSDRRAAA